MGEPGLQPASPKPKLRWYQFCVRTLLVLATVFAIPCSWIAVQKQQGRREREAMAAIKRLRGGVDWETPSRPAWLRSLLGDDFFDRLRSVSLDSTGITDAELAPIDFNGLTQLEYLCLDCTQVTDAGLEHLKGLAPLKSLLLCSTRVTDAGLEHLKGLNQLQMLLLDSTKVTDAGLEHLKGCGQLRHLYLHHTQVTNSGVKRLQQALPKCKIDWEPPTKDERQSPATPDQLR